jgi:hypothetical protein
VASSIEPAAVDADGVFEDHIPGYNPTDKEADRTVIEVF